MQQHIEEKISYNKNRITGLLAENVQLENQKQEAAGKKGIEKWRGHCFESSSGLTREFSDFARDYKKELKKALGPGYELVNFTRNHFDMSGFARNLKTGRLAYISIGDVRYNRGDAWYNNILVRSAKHDRDWTGGGNCWADWAGLRREIEKLTAKDNWY